MAAFQSATHLLCPSPHPPSQTSRRRAPSACAPTPITRRAALSTLLTTLPLLPLLPLLPTASHARAPKTPLPEALQPLLRIHDALPDLAETVESGTNGDVRRLMKTLLRGSDLPGSLRASAVWLPTAAAERVATHGREGYEYLAQVVEYFEATATRAPPTSDVLAFCLRAIRAASLELDAVLAEFPAADIAEARVMLEMPSS